jgi:hypothetical protein
MVMLLEAGIDMEPINLVRVNFQKLGVMIRYLGRFQILLQIRMLLGQLLMRVDTLLEEVPLTVLMYLLLWIQPRIELLRAFQQTCQGIQDDCR